MGLWLLWCGITISWSTDKFAGIVLWLHWFVCAIFFLVLIDSLREVKQLDRIAFISTLGAAIVSAIGISQSVFSMDLIPQGIAPGSTFSNKNIAVQFVVLAWPLSLLYFLLNMDRARYWLSAGMHALIVIYLIYTTTRAGWIAISISFLMLMGFILITGFWRDIQPFMVRVWACYRSPRFG